MASRGKRRLEKNIERCTNRCHRYISMVSSGISLQHPTRSLALIVGRLWRPSRKALESHMTPTQTSLRQILLLLLGEAAQREEKAATSAFPNKPLAMFAPSRLQQADRRRKIYKLLASGRTSLLSRCSMNSKMCYLSWVCSQNVVYILVMMVMLSQL